MGKYIKKVTKPDGTIIEEIYEGDFGLDLPQVPFHPPFSPVQYDPKFKFFEDYFKTQDPIPPTGIFYCTNVGDIISKNNNHKKTG